MFKSGNFLSCMDSFLPFSGTVHYIKKTGQRDWVIVPKQHVTNCSLLNGMYTMITCCIKTIVSPTVIINIMLMY